MIASTLFFETAELTNVPDILDVHLMKEILESLGSKISFEKNVFSVDNTHCSLTNIRHDLFKKARATYYLIPSLLARFGEASLMFPGGCSIGKRPIDGIVDGLKKLGYQNSLKEEMLSFS
jgi:UDP-N-acetylglucosamine 1-carboxyvinyltransferase